jgi:uncharacterized protein (TIGR03000 family)
MRPLALRVLLSVPVLIVLGLPTDTRAQNRAWGMGVGVGFGRGGFGPGFGPGWGPGFGPYWGLMPNYYQGFYGNGMSMYGPPVPTGRPIPGVFGGGDSRFFDPIPPAFFYPGWVGGGWVPLGKPAPLPAAVIEAPAELPPPGGAVPELPVPKPVPDKPAPLEVEVRLPRADARLFIDGTEAKSTGAVREFSTPPLTSAEPYLYELRAEWTIDGRTTTHTKRVAGRAGDKVVVEFK